MSPMLTIAKREFRSYFDSPLAYVVFCLSFLFMGVVFFRGLLGFGGFWQANRASMQQMFELIPIGLTLLVVPVVTMRLMAEERRSGTLEMLITLPVKDSDVILGKYLGALGLVYVLILGTVVYPIVLFTWPYQLGPVDWNTVGSGYLGLVLYSAATVAIGLLVSSLTQSQAIAFFVTFFALLSFYFLSRLAQVLPANIGVVLNYMSFEPHFQPFARGLIDTRDVVFFLSIAALALILSFRALERRKWA